VSRVSGCEFEPERREALGVRKESVSDRMYRELRGLLSSNLLAYKPSRFPAFWPKFLKLGTVFRVKAA
jgi:hypothetical protein